MNLNIGPRGILQIDDARIIFRNFSGAATQYNREGERNFSLVIEDENLANELIEDGWNVKIKAPREEGDIPFMHLPIKVKFNERGPKVYLKSGARTNMLDEETVGLLDNVDILAVEMDVRPYDWQMSDGKSGRTAYLQAIWVTQEVDRFAERYAEEECPAEEVF